MSVVGLAELTDDEERKIETFIDRQAVEHESFQQLRGRKLLNAAPEMYCIVPHALPYSEPGGRYARMRFSCAGFVFEAYRKAGIVVLDIASLPQVGMEVIRSAYPAYVRMMDCGRINPADLGLEGDGPWPVLLCGYLFHALNRDAQTIRESAYVPQADDQCFA